MTEILENLSKILTTTNFAKIIYQLNQLILPNSYLISFSFILSASVNLSFPTLAYTSSFKKFKVSFHGLKRISKYLLATRKYLQNQYTPSVLYLKQNAQCRVQV